MEANKSSKQHSVELTKWGKSKFGAGSTPALTVAIPVGIVLAALAALVLSFADAVGEHKALGWLIFTICLSGPIVAGVFAFVVDRTTMLGAPQRPDESIERQWTQRALAGMGFDLLLTGCLALGILTVLDVKIDGVTALLGMVVLGFASLGVRYFVNAHRG